jgi:hypothetical protein
MQQEIDGLGGGGTTTYTGSGDPNGVQVGNVGDGWRQIDAGVYIREWIKTSGTGTNTGWE